MSEMVTIDPGGKWPVTSGMVRVRFEQSIGEYWLEKLIPGEKVGQAVLAAGEKYALASGKQPIFAWMGKLPGGAEEFTEVGSMSVVRANWVKAWYVAIGRGGQETIGEGWRKWRRITDKEVLNG